MTTELLVDAPAELSGITRAPAARRFGGVTVIMPCHNEVAIVASTVRQITRALRETNRPYELLVVDDGSRDGSDAELRSCGDVKGLSILTNQRNRGYGYSLKRAVRQAQYELIVIADADGTYPVHRIDDLLSQVDGADMVVGARTGVRVNVPLIRRPAKWALRKLASHLAETDIPDLNSGFRVMKRSLINRFMPLLPDGFSFTTTITLALLTHGYEVRYTPIEYAKRTGRSSIRPVRDTIGFLSLIVRTVMYFKPLKIFAPVSALLFVLAVAVAVMTKFLLGQVADVTSVTLALASVQMLAIGLLADLIDKRSPSFSKG